MTAETPTPRTDERADWIRNHLRHHAADSNLTVMTNHACALERELATALRERDEAMDAVRDSIQWLNAWTDYSKKHAAVVARSRDKP